MSARASRKSCDNASHVPWNGYNSDPLRGIFPAFSISTFLPPTVRIGQYVLSNNLVVAPMAGVTDRPFRLLCKRFGAGYAVSEMVASNPDLRGTEKSRRRTDHVGEPPPVAGQIAGADPALSADAARYHVGGGAGGLALKM